MIHLMQDEAHDYGELALRQNKILNNMLGCEIDFLIKGLDPEDTQHCRQPERSDAEETPNLLSG